MRVIKATQQMLETRTLVIGFQGENLRTQLRIDCAATFAEYPNATPALAIKPPSGATYPVFVERDGNEIVWDIVANNLALKGDGELQLTFYKDNVIAKTVIGTIRVNRSLQIDGEMPDVVATWIENANRKLAEVDAQIVELEGMVDTATDAATRAEQSASTASTKAEQAAGSAAIATEKATEATNAAGTATAKAAEAEQSAQTASTVAQTVMQKALEAAQSATNAAISAETATTKAEEAAASAQAAASARDMAQTTVAGAIAGIQAEGQTQVDNVSAAGATQIAAVEAKGEEVLNSIPSDYTELSDDVSGLRSAINDMDSAIFTDKSASGSVVSFSDGNGMALKSLAVDIVCIQSGSGDPSPTNIRAINGFTGMNINVGAVSGTPDETYTVDWGSEAGTVYHGTLNVTTGILTVDWVIRDMSQFNNITKSGGSGEPWIHRFVLRHWPSGTTWQKAPGQYNFVSDIVKTGGGDANYTAIGGNNEDTIWVYDDTISTVDEFKAKYAGHYIAYEVKERFYETYQLTPMQIMTLVGNNNVWANTGDIALTYRVGLGDQIAGKQDTLTFDTTPIANSTNPVTSGGIKTAMSVYDNTVDAVATMQGKTVMMTTGDYWGNPNIGVISESGLHDSASGYGKHCMVSLPAGKTLRISTKSVTIFGGNVDPLIKNYFTFDASTGICIDLPQTPPLKDKVFTYYLRYNVDAHVYVNCLPSFDCYVGIFDSSTPYADLGKTVGITQPSILEINDEKYIGYGIRSLKWPQRIGSDPSKYRKPAVFLHCSDIHEGGEDLKRIVGFMNEQIVAPYLDDAICSGDIVYNTISDGMSFATNVEGSEKIILVPGNHDAVKKPGSTIEAATPAETYATLFADRISNWGVTQPTGASSSGLCYFYKDYVDQKLRIICLDGTSHNDSTYISDEANWLADVLDDAYNLEYSVVCVDHYPFKPNSYTMVDCSFSPRYAFDQPSGYLPDDFVNAVEAFISNGGDFVCWLAGHWHQDYVMLHNDGHQLCIGVACATHENRSNLNITYGDSLREANTKGQDLFNLVGIDTLSKNISILRIGCDLTRLMNSRKHLCINYETKTVVWND